MSIAADPLPVKRPYLTHLDLPYTDNKPVENSYHPLQSEILRQSLLPVLQELHPGGDFYIGTDSGIYFRTTDPPERGCRAPDFFYVPNVPKLLDGEMRLSYVMWVEAVAPTIVIEYVSGNGAEEHDDTPHTGKFWVYERAIRAPYYAIWDWRKNRLEVFVLNGSGYRKMTPNDAGRYPIAALGIELGSWDGSYADEKETWLRAWDQDGNLLPTFSEHALVEARRADAELKRANAERRRADAEKKNAEAERSRADAEKKKADSEHLRAEKLAARLRELGIDPNQV